MQLIYPLRLTMTDTFINAFSRLIWDSDLVGSRFTLALAEFMWGILLLWPGNTFDREYYHNMAYFATESIWGVIFVISSILQFTIVMKNSLHSKCARVFAAWNAALWVLTVGSLLIIYPLSAALGGEVALALSAVWIFARPYILAEGYKRANL